MSDYGMHQFVDPSRIHGYEGPPGDPHVNPNDFANEYDYINASRERQAQLHRDGVLAAAACDADPDFAPAYTRPLPERKRPLARIDFALNPGDRVHFIVLSQSVREDELFAPQRNEYPRILNSFGHLSTESLARFRYCYAYVLSVLPREIRMEAARRQARSDDDKRVWYRALRDVDRVIRPYLSSREDEELRRARAAEWINVVRGWIPPLTTEVADGCIQLIGKLPRES